MKSKSITLSAMDEEVKNIMKYHRKPLTKINIIGPKLFFKDSSLETQKLTSENLEGLESALKNRKVDKRCSRLQAEWDTSSNLAKVSKVVKGLLENFGYQDKNGIYMYPEEMLYLVETNRMEVNVNNVPLTVQECYNIVLHCSGMNLTKYRVYKKLIHQGYKVVRYSEIVRKRKATDNRDNINIPKEKNQPSREELKNTEDSVVDIAQQKRQLDDSEVKRESKKICIEQGKPQMLKLAKKYLKDLYEQSKQSAPHQYIPEKETNSNPDYCIFKTSNFSKTPSSYDLYICETSVVDQVKSSSTHPTMFAICSGDNISFYSMGIVSIPTVDINLDQIKSFQSV